jgi:hypothetical protein
MRKKRTVAINVLLLAILAGVISWAAYDARPASPTLPTAPVSAPRVRPVTAEPLVIDELTADQHRFMKEQFLPRWDIIRRTYPIPDLRARFDRLAQRLLTKNIRLQVSALYHPSGRRSVLGEADREGRQAVIRFFEPALRDFVTRVPDQDTRDDIVIGMMLHEEYHLTNHVFNPLRGQDAPAANSLRESDTWWWCCETIYTPMVRAGRLRHLPTDDAINGAMSCFNAAAGNPASEAWLRFCLADPALKR